MANKALKILISGGGTGGHVFPAIAIGKALKKIQPEVELLYVGAKGKIEMTKVPEAGFKVVGLNIAGFQRSLSLKNLLFPFKLAISLLQAFFIILKFKPDAAIGVGGYASGPTLRIASFLGIPTFLQEANSLPGVTNRLLAKKARKVFVAFDGMDKYFAAEKIKNFGNPIRDSIKDITLSKQAAVQSFGLDVNRPIVFITGGSLGARAINKAIAARLSLLKEKSIQLIWQVGKIYLNDYQQFTATDVLVLDFVKNMDEAYAAADVIVSRAGGTISELAIVGKPCILLPSPNVAEDHQTVNVMSLVKVNAAILVTDAESEEKLCPEIIRLLDDTILSNELASNIKKMAKPNAANDIAQCILNELNQGLK